MLLFTQHSWLVAVTAVTSAPGTAAGAPAATAAGRNSVRSRRNASVVCAADGGTPHHYVQPAVAQSVSCLLPLLLAAAVAVQPAEIYVDDESKLTLHGLVQHYVMLHEEEKNRKLTDLLDALDFNQVRFISAVVMHTLTERVPARKKRAGLLRTVVSCCLSDSVALH